MAALRFHGAAYLHGHTVGGTNPSLVEAMAAGNPVIAHDNEYNRWVAGDAARLLHATRGDVDDALDELLRRPPRTELGDEQRAARHAEEFTWEHVAGQYEAAARPAPAR